MTCADESNLTPVNDPATPGPEGGSAPAPEEEEEEERTIGGRATKDERYLVDRACLELDMKRGPFVVEAAVEKARQVLAAKAFLNSRPA